MNSEEIERFFAKPVYAMDFHYRIGDIEGFIDFSESNIEWLYKQELFRIRQLAKNTDFPDGYQEHLEENAEHRFTVSLPMHVRYSGLISLCTSIELLAKVLKKSLRNSIESGSEQESRNSTVFVLEKLCELTSIDCGAVLQNIENLFHVRNCIVHNAGIEQQNTRFDRLPNAIGHLVGFKLVNYHFLGKHVWIEKDCLTKYISESSVLADKLYKTLIKKSLLKKAWPRGTRAPSPRPRADRKSPARYLPESRLHHPRRAAIYCQRERYGEPTAQRKLDL